MKAKSTRGVLATAIAVRRSRSADGIAARDNLRGAIAAKTRANGSLVPCETAR
jgi:hypothetical protein